MTDLRYRWGNEAPQESPAPPRDTTVALVLQRLGVTDGRGTPDPANHYLGPVATHVLWQGDVTAELRAWARWCALAVVELWDCPEVVRRYLESGDAELQVEARATAKAIYAGACAFYAAYAAVWAIHSVHVGAADVVADYADTAADAAAYEGVPESV